MISVVMATFNGATTLPITLDAFCKLRIPSCGFELIAVNNASTDSTRTILQSYDKKLPLKIIDEPTPGRTNAMNAGIRSARGQLIIFTDDDVIPDSDWLNVFESAANDYPDTSVFAGQIRHFWQKQPPSWLVRLGQEGRAYGGTEANRKAGPIAPEFVKGANFALRSLLLDKFGFSSSIGPDGTKNYPCGSETELLMRLNQAGYIIQFLPDALIQHIVRPHEVSIRPVLRRYFRVGRGIEAIKSNSYGDKLATVFGFPRYLIPLLAIRSLRAIGFMILGRNYEGVRALMDVAQDTGRAYEWRKSRQS